MKHILRRPTFFLTCILVLRCLTSVQAQKAALHKPINKQPVSQGLTLRQINEMIGLINLPDINDYLTSHRWTFTESEPADSVDKVYYIHKNINGIKDGDLAVYFCNNADYSFCSNPSYHEGTTTQHCYIILYMMKKDIYDRLKAEMQGIMKPTGSMVRENSLTTIYRNNRAVIKFIVDNSGSHTNYVLLCQTLLERDSSSE